MAYNEEEILTILTEDLKAAQQNAQGCWDALKDNKFDCDKFHVALPEGVGWPMQAEYFPTLFERY